MKFKHTTLINISGAIWMCVGIFLLSLGLNFINSASKIFIMSEYPLITFLIPYFGTIETTSIVLIALSLLIGSLKSKMVLSKVVTRNVNRIFSLPNPSSITSIIDAKYIVIIGIMMFLGFLMKFFAIPQDIRGMVDVAVGSALITGSVNYYKHASIVAATSQ